MSTIVSGYPRIASTVEQGTIASMYARVIVLGMHMRNEALEDIVASIKVGGMSGEAIENAYNKYYYATQYISMVTGTARDTYKVFSWIQATTGFAKGLIKIPMAQYSSIPFKYLSKTNSLNHKVIARLDKITRDKIGFEEAMGILKDMSKLIRKIIDKGVH